MLTSVAFPYSSAILLAFTIRLLGCPSTQGTAHGSGNFGCLDFPTTGASAGCGMTSPSDVPSGLAGGAKNVTFPSSSLHPGQSRPQWHQLPCVSPARPQPGELKRIWDQFPSPASNHESGCSQHSPAADRRSAFGMGCAHFLHLKLSQSYISLLKRVN